MNIYLTADTHIGHRNIISHCGRKFTSVEEMDEAILRCINDIVGVDDWLIHLGDIGWRGTDLAAITGKIRCKRISLVRGNHDDRKAVKKLTDRFYSVDDLLYWKQNRQKYVMCHYPFHSWKRGAVHFHGHCHGTLASKPWRLDVGWDVWGRPISLEEATIAATVEEQGMY